MTEIEGQSQEEKKPQERKKRKRGRRAYGTGSVFQRKDRKGKQWVAQLILEQGKIKVEDGDIGLNTSLGHPQGTFKLHDFVTTPTMLRVALQMYQASNDPRMYPPLTLMRMVKNGDFGASSGQGFYDWSDPRNPKARDLSHYVISTAEDIIDQLK